MYAKSLAVAAAFTLATSVVASEPERPRIYYPHKVKRQYFNTTITSADTMPVPENTPDSSSTSRRGLFDDLISEIIGDDTDSATTTTTTRKPSVTTIVKHFTVIVTPTPGSGSGRPRINTSPKSRKPPTSTEEPIVIAPTGIIVPETSPTDFDTKATTSPNTAVGNSTVPVTTTPVESDPITTTAIDETTTKPGGILDPILTLILPDPKTTTSPVSTSAPTTESAAPEPTTPESTLSKPSSTTTSELEETPEPTGILPPLLPSTILGTGILSPSISVEIPPVATANVTTTDTEIPTTPPTSLPTEIPTESPTGVPVTTSTELPSIPNGNSTSIAPPVTTGPPTTIPTDIPVTNITSPVPPTTTLPLTSAIITTSTDNGTATVTTSSVAPPTLPVSTPTTTAITTSEPTTSRAPVTSLRPTATFTNSLDWLPTTIVIEPTTMTFSAPTEQPTASKSKSLPTNIPTVIQLDDPDKTAPKGTKLIQIGFLSPLNYVFVAGNTFAAAQIFAFLPQALADAGGFDAAKVQISQLEPLDTREEWGYVTTIAMLHYPETLVDKLQMDLWAPNSAIYNNANKLVRDLTNLINPKVDILGRIKEGGPTGGGGAPPKADSGDDTFDSNDQGGRTPKQKATVAGIAVGAIGLSAMYGAAMFIVARRYKRKKQSHRRSSSVVGSESSSEMRYNGASPPLMGGALLSRDMSSYGGMAEGRYSHGSDGSHGSSARTANISAPIATENSLGWN